VTRFYISADIEGAPGVVSRHQMTHSGKDYASGQRWMTGMVAAAAKAAIESGATEIVVSDSHGLMQNILLDELPPQVQVVRGFPRPLLMMDGIEHGRYDGAMLLGYHGGHTLFAKAIAAHTFSGAQFREVRLNGKPVNEAAISALVAGYFGVPVVVIGGDDGFIKETSAYLPDAEVAVYKWSYSDNAARVLTPDAAAMETVRAVKAAIARLDRFRPLELPDSFAIEIDYKARRAVEYLEYLPVFERTGPLTVQFHARDPTEMCRIIMFLAVCQFGSAGE